MAALPQGSPAMNPSISPAWIASTVSEGQHAQHHVAVGIDPCARQPVAQHQRMAGKAMDDADDRFAPPQADGGGKIVGGAQRIGQPRDRIGIERGGKIARHDQHVAIDAQLERRGQRGGLLAEAERDGDRKRGKHVRGLDLTIDEPVAQRRPAGRAHEIEGKAFLLGKPPFARDGQNGHVVQGQERDTQLGGHEALPASRWP
jgi:hypothetical protein